jgi:phosphatidylglycerophosphatase A
MKTRLAILLATVGHVGHFPVAPGTAGSAAAMPLFFLLRMAGSPALEVAAILVLLAAGCWAGSVAEAHYARTDPGYVVLDEVVGMLVTLLLVPVSALGALVGFFLFRLFDIVKPFPARQCERLHGGVGIMTDDVVAGIYANLALRLIIWIVSQWSVAGGQWLTLHQ